jgi:hypothetical protein
MDYFTAVQQGRSRVRAATEILQDVAGASYPVLFLKMGGDKWEPVGEEMLYSLVPGTGGTTAVVICDSDGNTKAISSWMEEKAARTSAAALEAKGIRNFTGKPKLPV